MEFCGACYCRKIYCRGCKGYHCKCRWTGFACHTWYRKHLNETCADGTLHKNGRYEQKTRPYGDYLYYQDREKFEVDFKEWSAQIVKDSQARHGESK